PGTPLMGLRCLVMILVRNLSVPCALAVLMSACGAAESTTASGVPFKIAELKKFDEPWAMTFLPDGRLLVTEKAGALRLYDLKSNSTGAISGVPAVVDAGQGGLGDVVLHPDFAKNQFVYLSYAEAGNGGAG